MKTSIRRYKQMVEDFDAEYKGMRKYAERKQLQRTKD